MERASCSSILDLHHVEVLCSGAVGAAQKFCSTYGFRVFAEKCERVAVRSNQTVFLFRERHSLYPVDTVSSLCFAVRDVRGAYDRAVAAGGEVSVAPTTLEDRFGRVEIAEVKTPFGNSALKFVCPVDYAGAFLPGYEAASRCATTTEGSHNARNACNPSTQQQQKQQQLSNNSTAGDSDDHGVEDSVELTCGCDHVTFACHRGTLDKCVQWFANCLGFQRLMINHAEEPERGFVVDGAAGSVGMRLKAMDYFRCRESQLALTANVTNDSNSSPSLSSSSSPYGAIGVKLVFAEPLDDGANQVQVFLNDHGGPGIQHIGLTSADIFSTIQAMRRSSAEFIFIPPDFYQQCQDLVSQSCVRLPENTLSKLEHSNILLDIEDNVLGETRYLMQAFTKPLFSKSTFFLEVIQRVGATGFGAGNITALWRALQQHFARLQQQQRCGEEPAVTPSAPCFPSTATTTAAIPVSSVT